MVNNRPVYNIETVQMLESAQELGAVKSTPTLVEFTFALKVVEKLSTIN